MLEIWRFPDNSFCKSAAIGKILRPNEVLKLACEVSSVPIAIGDQPHPQILAVVSNVDSGIEQGCLILLQRPSSPIVVAVVPIFKSLRIQIDQRTTAADGTIAAPPKQPAQTRTVTVLHFGRTNTDGRLDGSIGGQLYQR